jgi:hypothetical protein
MLLSRCSLSLRAIRATVAVCLYATAAHAYSRGVTTQFFGSTGCNRCHVGGLVPTVQLSGPTLQTGPKAAVNGTVTFTFLWTAP